MSDLLGPIVVLSGFGVYLLSNVWLGRFRRMPYEFITLSTVGAVWSVVHAFAAPSNGAAVAAAASVGLLALLYWFYFSFSMYAPRADRLHVGDVFPAFTLPASDASIYDSASARGKRQLLVFYRGSW